MLFPEFCLAGTGAVTTACPWFSVTKQISNDWYFTSWIIILTYGLYRTTLTVVHARWFQADSRRLFVSPAEPFSGGHRGLPGHLCRWKQIVLEKFALQKCIRWNPSFGKVHLKTTQVSKDFDDGLLWFWAPWNSKALSCCLSVSEPRRTRHWRRRTCFSAGKTIPGAARRNDDGSGDSSTVFLRSLRKHKSSSLPEIMTIVRR